MPEASTAWDGAKLHLHYAASLEETYPEVAALLTNYQMPPEVLSEAGFEMSVNGMDAETFARNWVDANEDVILGWLTGQ